MAQAKPQLRNRNVDEISEVEIAALFGGAHRFHSESTKLSQIQKHAFPLSNKNSLNDIDLNFLVTDSIEDLVRYRTEVEKSAFSWLIQTKEQLDICLGTIQEIGDLFHRGGIICVDVSDILYIASLLPDSPEHTLHFSADSIANGIKRLSDSKLHFSKGVAGVIRGEVSLDEYSQISDTIDQLCPDGVVLLGHIFDSQVPQPVFTLVGS